MNGLAVNRMSGRFTRLLSKIFWACARERRAAHGPSPRHRALDASDV